MKHLIPLLGFITLLIILVGGLVFHILACQSHSTAHAQLNTPNLFTTVTYGNGIFAFHATFPDGTSCYLFKTDSSPTSISSSCLWPTATSTIYTIPPNSWVITGK